MNITDEVRKQILPKAEDNNKDKLVFLSAIIKCLGSLGVQSGKLFLELESKHNEPIVTALQLIKEATGAVVEYGYRNSGKTYYIRVGQKDTQQLFSMFDPEGKGGITMFYGLGMGINNRLSAQAYARGAFLSCGGAYIPDEETSGYHIEFLFFGEETAREFQSMMERCGITLSLVDKGSYYGVYAKSEVVVSDTLAFMGASESVMEIAQISLVRNIKNDINRTTNCKIANIEKSQKKIVAIVQAVEKLKQKGVYNTLDQKLKIACEMREEYQQDTLEDLAKRMGISKSGLNHRFTKILTMAKEEEEKYE